MIERIIFSTHYCAGLRAWTGGTTESSAPRRYIALFNAYASSSMSGLKLSTKRVSR